MDVLTAQGVVGLRIGLGALMATVGLWGVAWYTWALRESGRWFAIRGLFRFGPDWWLNVFVERPGRHAYWQYAVPYIMLSVLIVAGALLIHAGYRAGRKRPPSSEKAIER